MARIPQRFIDDLLDRVDIVDVISARIDLRKSGKNYSARCPFHDEKTPSFSVSPDKQFYYCFGCGAGGNAIGFVMDHDHLGFPDAVEILASQVGMEVPKEAAPDAAADNYRRKLYALLAEADRFYRQQLRTHSERNAAVKYLKKRGLSGEISTQFGIGFAPPGWDNLINRLCEDDSDMKLLQDAGLVIQKEGDQSRYYDRFRNRIIFPIRDTRGRTIGFGGRVLDDSKPKYLNSPETPVFHKGRELYGLHEAHKTLGEIHSLLVVEGYMDVVALAQYGILNAVATLGTAATTEHLEKLFRYTSEVIFCFDGDEAGTKAARRAMETSLPVMTDGRRARFLFLPDGEDPDSLVRKLGKEGFNKLLDGAMPLSEFLFNTFSANLDTSTPDGKARLSQMAAPFINRLPAGVFRQLMLKELARRTDMDVDMLAGIIAPAPAPEPELLPNPTPDQPPPDYGDYEAPPGTDYDGWDGYPDTPSQPAPQARKLKLSPLQRLILLLLHMPQLRSELSDLAGLEALDDPDARLLDSLCKLLDEQPHFTLNHIIGFWRGVYGAEAGENLVRIAAADMLASAREAPRDNVAEFRDIKRHLQTQLRRKRPAIAQIEEMLNQNELGAEDQKHLLALWHHSTTENERTPELYQLIKQALATKNRQKNKT
jgi:DNA primase